MGRDGGLGAGRRWAVRLLAIAVVGGSALATPVIAGATPGAAAPAGAAPGAASAGATPGTTAAPAGAAALSAHPLTTPARLFAVGMVTRTFVDRSRQTPANGSVPARPRRRLPTLVLYPATGRAGATARRNAPPDRRVGPFPLLVFSHGVDGTGPAYRPLLQQWAERGYVVAAPTFPLSRAGAPGGTSVMDFVHQPGDVSFVITQMLRLDHGRRQPVSGLIASREIGAVGHSLGAVTTLGVAFNSCCRDQRIKAAASIDGLELPFPDGTYFPGHTPPILLLHGTADQTVSDSASAQIYAAAPPPKFFVHLIGAPHTSFRQAGEPPGPAPKWEQVDVRAVADFFDYYLKGQSDALRRLQQVATVPGVASLQEQLHP